MTKKLDTKIQSLAPKESLESLLSRMSNFHLKVEDQYILFFPCSKIPKCKKPDNCGSYLMYKLSGFLKVTAMEVMSSMRGWEENWKEMAESDFYLAAERAIAFVNKSKEKENVN